VGFPQEIREHLPFLQLLFQSMKRNASLGSYILAVNDAFININSVHNVNSIPSVNFLKIILILCDRLSLINIVEDMTK
jgi:hypothetical protein